MLYKSSSTLITSSPFPFVVVVGGRVFVLGWFRICGGVCIPVVHVDCVSLRIASLCLCIYYVTYVFHIK